MRAMARTRAAALGLAAGVALAGIGVLGWTGAAIANRAASGDLNPARLIAATHLPPLLTAAGEAVTLRYDIYCAPPGNDPESGAPCDAGGTVYVRPGGAGPFRPLPLRPDATASEGRYVAVVPPNVAGDARGFSYYAVLRSNTTAAKVTLPAGGPLAPQRSRPLGATTAPVSLGTHAFGSPHAATARVVSSAWGDGPTQVGLEQGLQLQPIGGSSFDVDSSGAVDVLDEAHRRVLRFSPGGGAPHAVAVDIRGTIADHRATPLLHSFDSTGHSLGSWHVAEREASAVALGPDGPVALEYPAGQWMPVTDNGAGLSAPMQRLRGRAGRPLPNGDELVAEREGNEVRVAQVGPSGVRRSWQITSETPLGEIQLAKPLGSSVLVVVRVYTDARDEFEVLVLGDHGVARHFAVDSTAWAETAPLARFRLVGSVLYELGSTSAGLFVDRYDLEVRR
jgi:hypothetical protein